MNTGKNGGLKLRTTPGMCWDECFIDWDFKWGSEGVNRIQVGSGYKYYVDSDELLGNII